MSRSGIHELLLTYIRISDNTPIRVLDLRQGKAVLMLVSDAPACYGQDMTTGDHRPRRRVCTGRSFRGVIPVISCIKLTPLQVLT